MYRVLFRFVLCVSTLVDAATTELPLPGCYFGGKFYPPGEISRESDGKGWCYGMLCNENGQVIPWQNWNDGSTPAPTTTPPTTIPSLPTITTFPPTTSRATRHRSMIRRRTYPLPPFSTLPPLSTINGCYYDGKFYPPGEISRGSDGKSWCYGLICDENGQIIAWDNWNSGSTPAPTTAPPTTTPSPPTTTPSPQTTARTPRTIRPAATIQATRQKLINRRWTYPPRRFSRCYHNGKYYKNGEVVSQNYHGWRWCSGFSCSNGELVTWNDFNCELTTRTYTTSARTPTTPKSIKLPGSLRCYHNGRFYQDGDVVSRNFEGKNPCTGLSCKKGRLVPWYDSKCGTSGRTTILNLGTTPDFSSSQQPEKTLYTIESSSSDSDDTSSGATPWSPDTMSPTDTTLPPETSLPTDKTSTGETTTVPQSKLEGCYYRGKYFKEGEIISRNFEGRKWCYGLFCSGGKLTPWDDFNCQFTTSNPETTVREEQTLPPSSTQPIRTTPPSTSGPSRTKQSPNSKLGTALSHSSQCLYKGIVYNNGDQIPSDIDGENWCSGFTCEKGELIAWDDSICKSITTKKALPSVTTSPKATTNIPVSISKSEETLSTPSRPSTTPSQPSLCFHEGKFYEEGDIISSNFDGENWCFGFYCKGGNVIRNDDLDCDSSTTKGPATTSGTKNAQALPKTKQAPTTSPGSIPTSFQSSTIPSLCFHEGRVYEEGDLVSNNFDGDSWCSGLYCKDGKLIPMDGFNCASTTTEASDSKPTTPERTTIPRTSIQTPDITQSEKSTSPPTTSTTRQTTQCYYNEMYYDPGIISQGSGGRDWCYMIVCEENGEVNLWGSSDCKTRPPTTTPPPPTTTTPPPTTAPKLCYYNGIYFPAGEISRGSDGLGWSYGMTCLSDGQVIMWGKYNTDKK